MKIKTGGDKYTPYQARFCPAEDPEPVFEIAVGGSKGGTRHYIVLTVDDVLAMFDAFVLSGQAISAPDDACSPGDCDACDEAREVLGRS